MKNNSMQPLTGKSLADLKLVARALVNGEFHRGTIGEVDAPNKLLIDYDHKPPKFFHFLRDLRFLGITPKLILYRASHTRNHWHTVVYMQKAMPLLARIFCQLWLGSDKRRERHNFIRAYYCKRTDKYAQILFGEKLPYGKRRQKAV